MHLSPAAATPAPCQPRGRSPHPAARLAVFAVAAVLALLPRAATAQSGPPLRIIVGFAAGGAIDTGARALAPLLQAKLKQPVVVDNRPGGNGVIALQALQSAPADGNTLYMQSTAVISKVFIKDLQQDVLHELLPVAPLWTVSYFLMVNSAVPAASAAEFIAHARSQPGKLNYAAPTSSAMLVMETMKSRAGVELAQIPYKGSAPAALAMLSNEVQADFDALGTYRQHIDAGKIRPLMYTGKARHPLMPQVPTAAEAGLPELQISLTGGLWAKAGSPAQRLAQINAAVNEAVADAELKAKYLNVGWSAIGGPADELLKQTASEAGFWERAAKLINYHPE